MFPGRVDSVKARCVRPSRSLLVAASLAGSPIALADAVTEWNAFADPRRSGPRRSAPVQWRSCTSPCTTL